MQYDWQCKQCAEKVIIDRKMADSDVGPDAPCKCGAHDFKKLITIDIKSKNFILSSNGSGFHRDNYTATRSIK